MSEKRKSLIPGALLIVVGIILLLRQIDLLYVSWRQLYPFLLLGIGVLFSVSCFARQDKGAAFPAGMFVVLGLFFVLRNFGIFSFDYYFYYPREYWPVFVLAAGTGFIALFLARSRDWGALVPGLTLFALGGLFLLRNAGLFHWLHLADLWPIILIAVGAGIVINSLRRNTGVTH